MNAQYYIWADGNEQGPMSMQHLMRDWKSGNLPKGFLWRREDQESYQTPDGLEAEAPPKIPPTPPEPIAKVETSAGIYLESVRDASQYKHLRFWLGLVTIIVGLSGAMSSITAGLVLARDIQPVFGIVVGIIGFLTSCSVAAAVDQAARLAIDAVDLMIDRGRKGF
jgi:hypothetical protein